jgi:hypothetical protein
MSKRTHGFTSSAARMLSAALTILFFLAASQPGIVLARKPAAPTPQVNYGQVGKWDNGFNTGPAVHLHVLPNGKVLSWAQWTPEAPPGIQTYARLWDPATNTLTDVHNYDVYLFCSGHSLLPDGTLFITGGTLNNSYGDGTPKSTTFDYASNGWKDGADMNAGRWYPTNLALGNGETLVVSGSYCINGVAACETFAYNNTPQVLRTNRTWRDLTSAVYSLPLYPWMHLASDGRAYYSGPTQYPIFINTSGTGSVTSGRQSLWGFRDSGSAVMYDVDKVLIVGGGYPPTNTAEIINLAETGTSPCGRTSDSPPCYRYTGSMAYARRHFNTTILPDGRVLATGGTSGDGFNNTCTANLVKTAEVWNPDTNIWTPWAAATYPRIYHSTAALLRDGRVLVGGTTYSAPDSVCPGIDNQYQTEIFSPPYLYNSDGTPAARPAISTAPASVTYGQTFSVGVSGGQLAASHIAKVTLVRLSSVTHSFNMNQRFNNLSFYRFGSNLNVTMPTNANACPPGHYMLFIINDSGVPSVAQIVKVS